jgi:Domain of unknown function (DUF4835)
MLKKLIFSIFLLACVHFTHAQEFLTTVKIVTPQLQNTDRKVFDQLESGLRDFLNNKKWTNDPFEPNERIKLNFIITVSEELGGNTFKSELNIQATRPVFGSNYETPLLTHVDKDFNFTWDIGQPLDFVPDLLTDNLTATIGFYAYLILGLDYDSFSPLGGEPYFQIINNMVSTIPPAVAGASKGWQAPDGGKNRNRFWIAENFVSAKLKPFRQAFYTYHRKGLDVMSTDVEKGKVFILQALEDVDKGNQSYFNAFAIQMFGNTKRDELIEMFKVAGRPQKERVFQIMSKVDPANAQKYRELGI